MAKTTGAKGTKKNYLAAHMHDNTPVRAEDKQEFMKQADEWNAKHKKAKKIRS